MNLLQFHPLSLQYYRHSKYDPLLCTVVILAKWKQLHCLSVPALAHPRYLLPICACNHTQKYVSYYRLLANFVWFFFELKRYWNIFITRELKSSTSFFTSPCTITLCITHHNTTAIAMSWIEMERVITTNKKVN
eukprot:553551_1